jgi:hypothetical protein
LHGLLIYKIAPSTKFPQYYALFGPSKGEIFKKLLGYEIYALGKMLEGDVENMCDKMFMIVLIG